MTERPTVFVVDDEADVRNSLSYLLESADFAVETYTSAREFLGTSAPERPGVLVLDLRMPDVDGLELQQRLQQRACTNPIVFLTGHGDVPMAVRAMKTGAVDFLQKPVNDDVLIECIRNATQVGERLRRYKAQRDVILARIAVLTPRQRQVMDLVVAGESSKQVAEELCITVKTVEVHRKFILAKMQAESTVELVNMVLTVSGPLAAPDRPALTDGRASSNDRLVAAEDEARQPTERRSRRSKTRPRHQKNT